MRNRLENSSKLEFVDIARQSGSSIYQTANTFGINYSTLKKYGRHLTRGKPLFESDGRPSKLDEISKDDIRASMAENGSNPAYVRSLIRAECLKTARRRYPHGPPPRSAFISKSSVRKYLRELMRQVPVMHRHDMESVMQDNIVMTVNDNHHDNLNDNFRCNVQ
jgi:DNA-binding CsgD family transcriptional regulator